AESQARLRIRRSHRLQRGRTRRAEDSVDGRCRVSSECEGRRFGDIQSDDRGGRLSRTRVLQERAGGVGERGTDRCASISLRAEGGGNRNRDRPVGQAIGFQWPVQPEAARVRRGTPGQTTKGDRLSYNSLKCSSLPLLSPIFSGCTPARSSMVSSRFVIGLPFG